MEHGTFWEWKGGPHDRRGEGEGDEDVRIRDQRPRTMQTPLHSSELHRHEGSCLTFSPHFWQMYVWRGRGPRLSMSLATLLKFACCSSLLCIHFRLISCPSADPFLIASKDVLRF
jgi:hypothetical protein